VASSFAGTSLVRLLHCAVLNDNTVAKANTWIKTI